MTLRLNTMAEYEALKNRNVKATEQIKPSKFAAIICEADGIKFRSKKERRRYLELMALRHSGDVRYFLMQVPFRLPGNTKYLLDFLVFWKDGERIEDPQACTGGARERDSHRVGIDARNGWENAVYAQKVPR